MTDPRNYILVLLEEYKSLRDESKQASINMFTALQWGAAVLGVIIAAAFTQWGKQDAVVLLTFYLVVPILSATAMFLLLGEATRFKRVGDYICLIEQKASLVLDEFKTINNIERNWQRIETDLLDSLQMSHSELDLSDPLAWEQWLRVMRSKRTTEGHIGWIYKIRLGFFLLLMVLSFAIATYYALTRPRFLPDSWRSNIRQIMPEPYIKVLILLGISLTFILTTGLLAYQYGKRLDTNTKAFRRNLFSSSKPPQ